MEYTKTNWRDLPDTSTPITADKLNNLENGVEYLFEHGVGGDTLPIGIILPFTDEEIPTGYMLCDGSAISRTTYSDLFSIIGTTYGEGDGSTTFNLPNLKGRVPVGRDITDADFDTLGEAGGEKEHTLTIDEMPSHNHGYIRSTMGGQGEVVANTDLSSGYSRYGLKYQLTDTTSGQLNTNNSGESEAHNIMQPYQIVNYIIKASQTTATQAQVVDVYSASTTNSYSCNYVNRLETYSTDEIRVGTWINKPLYRKVYYVNAFANNSNVYLDINVENVDTVISANGYAKNSSHTETIFLNSSYSNTIYDAIVWEESTNKLRLHSTSDRSGYSGYVWIEYTKTTD